MDTASKEESDTRWCHCCWHRRKAGLGFLMAVPTPLITIHIMPQKLTANNACRKAVASQQSLQGAHEASLLPASIQLDWDDSRRRVAQHNNTHGRLHYGPLRELHVASEVQEAVWVCRRSKFTAVP